MPVDRMRGGILTRGCESKCKREKKKVRGHGRYERRGGGRRREPEEKGTTRWCGSEGGDMRSEKEEKCAPPVKAKSSGATRQRRR